MKDKSLTQLNNDHHNGCPCYYCDQDSFYYEIGDILKVGAHLK